MAVEKMKFLNVFGPVESFPAAAEALYENAAFHPEQAMQVLQGFKDFYPFSDINPYDNMLRELDALITTMDREPVYRDFVDLAIADSDIEGEYAGLKSEYEALRNRRTELRRQISDDEQILRQLLPILGFDFSLDRIFSLEFVRVRIGRLPRENYEKFLVYIQSNPLVSHILTSMEDEYVWGIYFAPSSHIGEVDSVLASMHFYRTRVSERAEGTPKEAFDKIRAEADALKEEAEQIEARMSSLAQDNIDRLLRLRSYLAFRSGCFSIRRYASRTAQSFYLIGWCPEREMAAFVHEMEAIEGVSCVEDEPGGSNPAIPAPPTRLRNLWAFRPFEFFVQMYGLPKYGEFDPTPLVAVFYTLFFGLMFGDVGQGLVLSVAGFLLWRYKRFALGKILIIIGLASACFGLMYGSVFGFELEGFGYRSLEPENLNLTLMVSIGLGVLTISLSILINIANGIRQKSFEKMLFSNNGLFGLIFYWSVITAAVCTLLLGIDLLNPLYIVGLIVLPLVFVFLHGPLSRLIAGEKHWMPAQKGQYVLENSFELFEVVLSFITNTFSFLRVGSYAMSHAGMMTVVYMLAENAAGSHNLLIVALGNVFVIAMEGLIVGIQCLRLDYYEMFSRFFDGTGKPFAPIRIDYSAKGSRAV